MKTRIGFMTLFIFWNSYTLAAAPLDLELQMHFQPTPEYIVLEKPEITISENLSGLSGQCPLMQGNYLSLWREYSAESSQLMSLLDQARGATPDVKGDLLPQVQEMQTQLKKTIDELNRLGRMEWSRESLKVLVHWSVPQSTLFDIPEDDLSLRDSFVSQPMADFLASRGLSVRPGFSREAYDSLKNLKKKTYFAGFDYQVTEAQYMGESSTVLLPFFGLDSFLLLNESEPRINFSYYKPMTWLEYCQLTQTAEFSITVKFALKNFGGSYAEKNQKFILRSIQNEK